MDGSGSNWIESGSAGSLCPADPASAVNSQWSQTRWEFDDGNGGLVESRDITVRCVTHT